MGKGVSREKLAEMIGQLLEDAGQEGAATYVEVHNGSCSVSVG
jgi:hypothetical protein